MSSLQPAAAAATAGAVRQDWKKMHEDRKALKKKHRDENIVKKLEKKRRIAEAANNSGVAQPDGPAPVSTLSIAVPGSIMDNAQSAELRTYLAGQIARAACIFRVDEVVVFDDYGQNGPPEASKKKHSKLGGGGVGGGDDSVDANGATTASSSSASNGVHQGCLQLARILQYLECPQYLRKFFFPLHKDLQYSGLLNPLDAPHHLRIQNEFIYREGVVTGKPARETTGGGSYVNIGLLNDCMVDKVLTAGLRVTVRLSPNEDLRSRKIKATVVSPSEPRNETGVYWGYTVRVAASLSDVFAQAPYDDGYDLTVGTSDKGTNVTQLPAKSMPYAHGLIVFGGLRGLELALENDDRLTVDDPSVLFDRYVNIAPGQGSRTIRTEEAILIALAGLEEKLAPRQPAQEFVLSEGIPQSEDTGVKRVFEPRRPKQTKTEPVVADVKRSVESTVEAGDAKADDGLSRFD